MELFKQTFIKVVLATSQAPLLQQGTSYVEASILKFSHQPTLRDLTIVLGIIEQEAPRYRLAKVQPLHHLYSRRN